MASSKLTGGLLYALILCNALLLLLACISYYRLFWPLLDLLSIGAPLLWGVNAIGVVYLLATHRRRARFPGLVLLLSLFCFGPYYRLSGPAERVGTEGIRIASFNTGNTRTPKGSVSAAALQTALDQMDADILCFQELDRYSAYSPARYPYRAFSPDKPDKSTQAIFSAYPIAGSGTIDFAGSANNAMYADIVVEEDTIRVYNVHLQSYRIRSPRLKRFLFRDNGMTFLRRIQAVAIVHLEQARLVKAHQDQSPHRSVICGDFNATPFSRTHRILSKGLNDSFGEAGSGYAGTYSRRGIPFRIDFILADPRLEVLRHQTHDIRLSDHLPVSATLRPHSQ